MLQKNLLIELRRQKEEGAKKKKRTSFSVSIRPASLSASDQLLCQQLLCQQLLCQYQNTSLSQCLLNKICNASSGKGRAAKQKKQKKQKKPATTPRRARRRGGVCGVCVSFDRRRVVSSFLAVGFV